MNILKTIPKTVFVLGMVSLFTDVSTEMITPIFPLFLSQVLLAGPMAIGLIEGVAKSTASLFQVFSGIWTDRLKRRKPLIVWGYGLSGFFRPFIGLAQSWPLVLVLRFIDRIGKGIRTSPRDALIADVTSPKNRGSSFGFHQSMDHAGAVIGPLAAAALASTWIGCSYRTIFLLSAIPGLIAWWVLVLGVREKKKKASVNYRKISLTGDFRSLGPGFPRLLLAVFIFTLGNSTDAFLLVRLSQVGVTPSLIFVLWAAFNVVTMVSTYYGGQLSDVFGRRALILSGWAFYALVYAAFAWVSQPAVVVVIFLAYGIYYGLCEPSEKALVADLVPQNLRGTAFGYYNLMVGLGALPASLLFGFVGQKWGYPAAFMTGAAFAGLASILLLLVGKFRPIRQL